MFLHVRTCFLNIYTFHQNTFIPCDSIAKFAFANKKEGEKEGVTRKRK